MTRATLGHTGRALRATSATVGAYLLVNLGALLRVLTALGLIDFEPGLEAAGALWAGAFVVFLLVFSPILFGPRRDGGSEVT